MPECCGTGCAVCVLDYADEHSTSGEDEAVLDEMLEAMEAATKQFGDAPQRETGSERTTR